jgi:hypothetical protein
MLRSPKFDNGDSGPVGGMASVMAMMIPTNTTDELLDKFAEELAKRIMTPSPDDPEYFPNASLHTDYGPDRVLADVAESVGLDCQFPWKTNMLVYGDYVSARCGYGASEVYHYALDNGKWLVACLHGPEMEKIKKFVTDGTLPEFMIE